MIKFDPVAQVVKLVDTRDLKSLEGNFVPVQVRLGHHSKHMNMYLDILNRSKNLFDEDLFSLDEELKEVIRGSSFLVIGGSGTIGHATVIEIFKRQPSLLHVVDISENNLVELVRDIRSSEGYISGEFKTFCLDVGSLEYDAFIEFNKRYDYVLNLSALKHVRSEKDPFTLMRLIRVNILNTKKL